MVRFTSKKIWSYVTDKFVSGNLQQNRLKFYIVFFYCWKIFLVFYGTIFFYYKNLQKFGYDNNLSAIYYSIRSDVSSYIYNTCFIFGVISVSDNVTNN